MVDFGSDLRKRTLVFCAAVALAIAAAVLLRGRRRTTHLLFAAFAGDIALWYLAQSLYGFLQASIWARVTAALALLLPHFAIRLFDAVVPGADPSRRLSRVAWILCVPVALIVVSPYHGAGYARGLVFFYVFGLLTAALAALALRGRKSTSRTIQRRVRYLVVVGALATTFSLFEFLWFIGAELPPFGSVLSVIFLFALAQSLERERLLDLYELLGRLLVTTALAFALAGIFYVCVTVVGKFNTMYLNAVLASVVILVLFEPLRSKVEAQIHQLFFRERFDLETALADARRHLNYTLEIDEMTEITLTTLETSRRVTAAGLYLRDDDGSGFARQGFFGPEPPERLEFTAAHPLYEHVARAGAVSLETLANEVQEGVGDRTEHKRVLEATSGLGPLAHGLVLGIRTEKREVLGLLVLADDRVHDAFSPEDIGLFETLVIPMAVVLENTRVYARMKTRERLAALGEMAAGLAHEIKNPLGAIKGAAQLLDEPAPGGAPLDANSREFLGIILEEVDRLDRVVSSVLDYARPGGTHAAPVDVNAVIRRTAQILAPTSTDHHVIETRLEDLLPPARIDAEKLRQVLLNLVQNAVYAIAGQGTVTLSSSLRTTPPAWVPRSSEPSQAWIEVSVSDQGPGISKQVLKNLFTPFVTTKPKGTGLGLAISQRIVQAAGGSIEVLSREGDGTTFSVILPAIVSPAASAPL